MKYPYKSSKSAIGTAFSRGNNLIRRELGLKNYRIINKITYDALKGKNSLKRFRKSPRMRKLHNEIIKKQFKDKHTIDRKDPDVYILGGLPSSGKSTVLRKKVPEKAIVIDSDNYKTALAKRSKSKLKKYVLAHATYLHEEADIIVNRAVNKGINEKRDIIYDATMKSYGKGRKLIDKFKKAGYDVHYLGTQKSPSKTLVHSAKRFLKKGRYVPLEYIKTYGNQISENSWKARKLADTYQIWDTNKLKEKIIAKSKEKMTHNFRNP